MFKLSCNTTLKKVIECYIVRFLDQWWKGVTRTFKYCCENPIGLSNVYLFERGFSSFTYIKAKHRNKLHVKDDLQFYLTKLEPNIEELCQKKQTHSFSLVFCKFYLKYLSKYILFVM